MTSVGLVYVSLNTLRTPVGYILFLSLEFPVWHIDISSLRCLNNACISVFVLVFSFKHYYTLFKFLRFCRKGEVNMVFTVLYLLVVGIRIKLEPT